MNWAVTSPPLSIYTEQYNTLHPSFYIFVKEIIADIFIFFNVLFVTAGSL